MKTNLSTETKCRREQLHLSQKQLGEIIGCSQSAISFLEGGNLNALSKDKIDHLCKYLGIEGADEVQHLVRVCFCSNKDCPDGHYECVGGKPVIFPVMYLAKEGEPRFCKSCGGVLMFSCLHAPCREPVSEGAAFCTHCGNPYIKIAHKIGKLDIIDFVNRMNERRRNFKNAQSEKSLETLPEGNSNKVAVISKEITEKGIGKTF